MTDYPDWQRAFRLVGADITLDIRITGVTVTLNVDIVAQTVGNLNINLAASAITLNVNLSSSSITLNVNLSSQSANINISFEDQSVAVFDAAKWFAHQAVQVFITGFVTLTTGAGGTLASRTVPAGKTFFVVGISCDTDSVNRANSDMHLRLDVGGTTALYIGFRHGGGIPLDTPMRATAGQLVELTAYNDDGVTATIEGGFWGYDE